MPRSSSKGISSLNQQDLKSSLFVKKGNELSLSEPALRGLLQDVLAKGVPFRFKAKGFSMRPFIEDGDVITVVPFSPPEAHSGDVVAFIDPRVDRLAVHRIVAKSDEGILMRGDNLPEEDGIVPMDNLLGLVTKVERQGQEVSLGLGPERRLVAFLSRKGYLLRLRALLGRWLRPLVYARNSRFRKHMRNTPKDEGRQT